MNALSRATSTVLQQGFESLEDADNVELLARGAAADIWRYVTNQRQHHR